MTGQKRRSCPYTRQSGAMTRRGLIERVRMTTKPVGQVSQEPRDRALGSAEEASFSARRMADRAIVMLRISPITIGIGDAWHKEASRRRSGGRDRPGQKSRHKLAKGDRRIPKLNGTSRKDALMMRSNDDRSGARRADRRGPRPGSSPGARSEPHASKPASRTYAQRISR